jgi:2-keto-4-pentenoate hydratase/2-oxohepta-3-ene-1,7-dioic acid hydratase in catechol pathway
MRLISFMKDDVVKVGLATVKGILDLAKCYQNTYGDTEAPNWLYSLKHLLAGGEDALNLVKKLERKAAELSDQSLFYRESEVKIQPPITNPSKILCVAANYISHTKELDIKVPEKPYFFGKFQNALVGHEGNILIPKTSAKVDHEIELAVVIGKKGKYISKSSAYEYVAGYTVFNDISFRDKQFPPGWPQKLNPYGQNWILGKSLDTAAPCGPYLVTKDEVGNPYPLRLTLRVNGEVRQDGTTDDMFFKIDDLIEYISDGLTLEPGDIIATGTPAGVAAAGKTYLQHNDVIVCEIERVGVLRNRVVRES